MAKQKTIPSISSISRRQFIRNASVLSAFTIVPRFVLGGPGYLPPSDKITLGFIGTGKQGMGLLNSFMNTGEVQVIAASEVYQAKLDRFVNKANAYHAETANQSKVQYKSCNSYPDFRRLLDLKEVDAVVIASPDHQHAVMAVEAAEAGKDIFCEKPLSLTVKEGRAMVDATRKSKRVFQTGSMQRSWPEFRQAVELVRNGYIGDIKTVKVSVGGPPLPYDLPEETIPEGLNWDGWLGPNTPVAFNVELAPPLSQDVFPNWRKYKEFGGGGMTDWGAHMFDIAQWALDMDESGPVEIIPPDGNEYPFLTYKYKNGITMTHEAFDPESNNGVRFIGSDGQIDVYRRKLITTPETLKDQVIGENEKHVYFSDNHYKDFLKAMRDRTPPICDVETGHRTASVCNIGNIAYALKRPLQWNPKKEKFKKDDEANSLLGRPMRAQWNVL